MPIVRRFSARVFVAIALAGMILPESLTAPFVALVSTLLFYDIRARRSASDETQTSLPV